MTDAMFETLFQDRKSLHIRLPYAKANVEKAELQHMCGKPDDETAPTRQRRTGRPTAFPFCRFTAKAETVTAACPPMPDTPNEPGSNPAGHTYSPDRLRRKRPDCHT